ncbi:MAG: glycoside hydrolase family 2 TIM barrel-domain containing protein [Fimbriimonas sp.]
MSLLLTSGLALGQASVPPEIEDEQNLGVNKQPWHAVLMPYASLTEALRADRYKSSFARSLNGAWKFHYVPRPEMRPVDFYRPEYDVSQWKEISVPSNWQVLGYGTPYYRNAGYTFKSDWPKVMSEPPRNFTAFEERNPVGSYRRTFTVPAGWSGRKVFLSFDGVDSAFFLWVNGQKVGYSQNSRNVAEFDVTPYLRKGGPNVVAAEVYRYSSGSYFEDQDMWRLSGIFRNVTLWSAPQTHIRDYKATTDLDAQYRNATLKVAAKVRNYGTQAGAPRTLVATVYDLKGNPLPGASREVSVPAAAPGQDQAVTVDVPVTNPAKWSAEKPNLYTVVLTLLNGAKTEELISSRVGFREVEIKGRVFTINGVPVKLKGANRHEHWPDTGHYVTEERMIKDIEVLKLANCNHVRTCHYPDDPRWYELCDQYGLYLVAEANAECHGLYGTLDREPRFEKMIVDRNVANVEQFKNHASVVLWSLGNENGGGINFRSALKAVKALDTTRPTFYEPFGRGEGNPADLDSHMYTDPAGTERIAQDNSLTKPFYLCEYAHAMNNSMGSIGEYNDVFDKYPALMGGAIWEWQDQGLWNRRDPKRQYLAYGGGFGEYPNDGFFIHKGVVFSDRTPKPHFPEVKRAYQWIGFAPENLQKNRVKVRNKFAFTNLKEYAIHWSYLADGQVVAKGTLPPLDLAPGRETVVTLPLPRAKLPAGTETFVNLQAVLVRDEPWAKRGHDIANAQFNTPIYGVGNRPEVTGRVDLQESGNRITVAGDGFAVVFDKAKGTISELRSGATNLLLPNGGPQLHLWRAEHRNDDGYAARDWNRAGLRDLKANVLDVTATRVSASAVQIAASIQYVGKAGFTANHVANYTVYGDGSVAVDNSVSPTGRRITLARVGVRMLLDRRLDALTYLARGPMENYSDRKRGSDVGLYRSTVALQLTPYSKPMECGNHEDTRWLALAGVGNGLMAQAEVNAPLQFSALPYTDEELDAAAYSVDLPKSRATVLCLSGLTLGVGSASCGPRPLPPYMVHAEPTDFSYVLRVLPKAADLGRLGRALPEMERPRPAVAHFSPSRVATLASPAAGPIEVSLDGRTWQPYAKELPLEGVTAFRVRTGLGDRKVVAHFALPVEAPAWYAKVSASSFQPEEGEPTNAVDGDPETYWHTRWNPSKAEAPHHLDIALRTPTTIAALKITPRQDMSNGRVKEYAIYLSDDGQTWGEPVLKGTLPDNGRAQTLRLPTPRKAAYIRFVAITDHSGGNHGAVGEIEIQ